MNGDIFTINTWYCVQSSFDFCIFKNWKPCRDLRRFCDSGLGCVFDARFVYKLPKYKNNVSAFASDGSEHHSQSKNHQTRNWMRPNGRSKVARASENHPQEEGTMMGSYAPDIIRAKDPCNENSRHGVVTASAGVGIALK